MSGKAPPRILIVTPEIASLPAEMASGKTGIGIGFGPLAETSAALVATLFQSGADIHVSLPNYRSLFNAESLPASRAGAWPCGRGHHQRVHLAQDRNFFYQERNASGRIAMDMQLALAFQREVVHQIIPTVQPDLIHCMDWPAGLIPAMMRVQRIPCLFSLHEPHSCKCLLSTIEDRGIDAAGFWQHLYFDGYPTSYEAVRETIPVDFLSCALFASRYIWMANSTHLSAILKGRCDGISEDLRRNLINKWEAGHMLSDHRHDPVDQLTALYEKILAQSPESSLRHRFHINVHTAAGAQKMRRSVKTLDFSKALPQRLSPEAIPDRMAS